MKTWPTFFVLILVGLGFLALTEPTYALSCDSFTVNPTSAFPDDLVELAWSTTDAVGVDIDNGIGAVSPTSSGTTTFQVPDTPGLLTFQLGVWNGSVFEPVYEYCYADLTVIVTTNL